MDQDRDQSSLLKIAYRLIHKQEGYDRLLKSKLFKHWLQVIIELKNNNNEILLRLNVIEILKTSTRGSRTMIEKDIIKQFILNRLSCVPKSITINEMDQLCNEIDWIPTIGKSILFLQGDYGNVYYMIANGRVGLYLEPSKEREINIAKEFGHLVTKSFNSIDIDLSRLGNNILNLVVSLFCYSLVIIFYFYG